jgi:hypothetical protein
VWIDARIGGGVLAAAYFGGSLPLATRVGRALAGELLVGFQSRGVLINGETRGGPTWHLQLGANYRQPLVWRLELEPFITTGMSFVGGSPWGWLISTGAIFQVALPLGFRVGLQAMLELEVAHYASTPNPSGPLFLDLGLVLAYQVF